MADRLALAEHHLYGMGINTYNEGQYRAVYDPVAASVITSGLALSENTLGARKPWYSGGYAAWIHQDRADAFTGSTFNLVNTGMENIRTLGMKHYELTDHLGNVLVTALDKKTGFGSLSFTAGNGSTYNVYKGFNANLSSVTDYYPFGMPMPGRSISSSWQRFGFNGKENDDEVYGKGNFVDLGERAVDTRIARLNWKIDPFASKFPYQSPYLYAGNSPVKYIDEDGNFQVDPGIKKNYPHIAKYLSTQIEKDVMQNTSLIGALKRINPNATDQNISNIYRNNSGPVLMSAQYPGRMDAAGFTEYNEEGASIIEINEKIFSYVESVLADKKSSDKEKQIALMYLYNEVNHEAAHEIQGYNGVDANGVDVKISEKDKVNVNESGFPEVGYFVEYKTFGIQTGMKQERKDQPNIKGLEGVGSGNPKFKEGEMENAYNRAVSTEEGKKTLPTVSE